MGKKHIKYVVQHGDTLYEISQKFAMPLNHILEVNPLIRDALIYPGQIINIPVNVLLPSEEYIEYIVQETDTLSSIAYQFRVDSEHIYTHSPLNPQWLIPNEIIYII